MPWRIALEVVFVLIVFFAGVISGLAQKLQSTFIVCLVIRRS